MKTILVESVRYDSDDDGHPVEGPQKFRFQVEEDFDPDSSLADLVSDETGFLVTGLTYRVSNPIVIQAGGSPISSA
jgi:hypothetical protein